MPGILDWPANWSLSGECLGGNASSEPSTKHGFEAIRLCAFAPPISPFIETEMSWWSMNSPELARTLQNVLGLAP